MTWLKVPALRDVLVMMNGYYSIFTVNPLSGSRKMRRKIYQTGGLYFLLIWLAGCSHGTRIGQPFMTVPHPGKYQLAYYTPSQEHPVYSIATVDGRKFYVKDDVVMPSAQSMYLLSHWVLHEGETVLDMGTGSGVQAVFAADKASHVLATDINPAAVEMAKFNAEKNGVGDRVEVRKSDLFSAIGKNEKFDVILFNIDYPHNEATQGLWKLHERFFAQVKDHLNPNGRLYYQSGRIENIARIDEMVRINGMSIISMRMDAALEVDKQPIVFLIKRNEDLQIKPDAWGGG